MRILVDAMGGDNAPDQIALGAIQAAKDFNCEVVLVGRGEAILRALKDQGIETLPKGVEIANADDVVDMHDDPAAVIKTRKNSSMLVGLQMLKDGGGDAFVSAGSTGALLTAATLIVKRIKGVRRKFAQEVGFLPPAVHVRDNLELKPSAYRITLRGVRDQPATNLVALKMERTLFEPTEGADDP